MRVFFVCLLDCTVERELSLESPEVLGEGRAFLIQKGWSGNYKNVDYFGVYFRGVHAPPWLARLKRAGFLFAWRVFGEGGTVFPPSLFSLFILRNWKRFEDRFLFQFNRDI